MTNTELKKLLRGTRIGLTERDKPALKAAQLYFVDGEHNVTECAKKAGCVRQTAARTINRIKEIIDQQGMEAVTVLVPKGKRKEIESIASSIEKPDALAKVLAHHLGVSPEQVQADYDSASYKSQKAQLDKDLAELKRLRK